MKDETIVKAIETELQKETNRMGTLLAPQMD